MDYRIVAEEEPALADLGVLSQGLLTYNAQHINAEPVRPLSLFLRDAKNQIGGGLLGGMHWHWLHIDILWISEALRGQGHGRALLAEAERRALIHGCQHVYLDTFSFQAQQFYLQLGYAVFGVLDDFPPGEQRFFLRKELISSNSSVKESSK